MMFLKTIQKLSGAGIMAMAIAAPVTTAQAADQPFVEATPPSWYISIFGGGSFITDDADFSNGLTTVQTDLDDGFTLGGSLGYRWHNFNLGGIVPRTEIEFNYSENDVDTIDFTGNGVGFEVVAPGSQISGVGVLGNLFFDFPNLIGNGFTPYVGGGVGVNFVNFNLLYGGAGLNLNDDEAELAWHVTGGVSYDVTQRAAVFVDVGFRQTVDAESLRRVGVAPVGGAGGGFFEDDINAIFVRGGLRVNF